MSDLSCNFASLIAVDISHRIFFIKEHTESGEISDIRKSMDTFLFINRLPIKRNYPKCKFQE